VSKIALSPDGNILVACDVDGMVVIFDLINHIAHKRFRLKIMPTFISFCPKGTYCAFTQKNCVQIWKILRTRKGIAAAHKLNTFAFQHDLISFLAWGMNDTLIVGMGSTINITCVLSGRTVSELSGHNSNVMDVAVNDTACINIEDESKSYMIHYITQSGVLYKWICEGENPRALSSLFRRVNKILLPNRNGNLSCAKFYHGTGYKSDSADFLVVGFERGSFSIYRLSDMICLQNQNISSAMISFMDISKNGKYLAFGTVSNKELIVWDRNTESVFLHQSYKCHSVRAIAFDNDSEICITGMDDGAIKVWNITSGFCFKTLTVHKKQVSGICLPKRKNIFITCSHDGTSHVFDLLRYRSFRSFRSTSLSPLTSVCATNDGSIAFLACKDPFDILICSIASGKVVSELKGHTGPISQICFSSYPDLIASASWDGTLRLWEPFKSMQPSETFTHDCECLALCFHPNGEQICVATSDGKLLFWQVKNGGIEFSLDCSRDLKDPNTTSRNRKEDAMYFTSLVYALDGEYLLATGNIPYACLYGVSHRILLRKFYLSMPRGPHMSSFTCNCVQFSPSGDMWAAGCTNGVRIFTLNDVISNLTSSMPTQKQHVHEPSDLSNAICMGNTNFIDWCVESIPVSRIRASVLVLNHKQHEFLLVQLPRLIASSRYSEFYLIWVKELCACMLSSSLSRNALFGTYFRMLKRTIQVRLRKCIQDGQNTSHKMKFALR